MRSTTLLPLLLLCPLLGCSKKDDVLGTCDAERIPAPQVERIVHLGFETRCELALDDGSQVAVQMTRTQAAELELEPGQIVLVRRPGVGIGGERANVVG